MKAEREPRRRRPLRVLVILLAAVVSLAAAGAAIVAVATLGLRDELEEGRRALESGRRALQDGRVADAAAAFGTARLSFADARADAASAPGLIAGGVPVLRRTFHVAAALADAGGHAAEAGLAIAGGIERLPGGVEALAPAGGALPIEAFASLAGSLEEARFEAARAVGVIRSSPDSILPGQVRDARRQALEGVEEVEHLFRSAEAFARALPGFAGDGEPRRYLFIAENPAEQRGTGGLWGAYAIVRVDAGRFSFSSFRPIQNLRNLPPGAVTPPNPDFRRNYDQWGGTGYWVNMNMTPDFPSAARVALSAWEAIGGEPLDGLLTADPFALRHLLTVTGTVRLSRPALAVNERNVVPLLSNRAFARFPDPAVRKSVLGDVARAVFDRFLALDGRAVPRLRAVVRAVGEGHLKIYAVDPAMQEALVEAGLDGSLSAAPASDLLGVVVNSAAGGKVDFFARRTIRHEVILLPGSASAASTVTMIENGAPTSGQPAYVIGPHIGRAGDNIPLISVFCAEGCRLASAERNGKRISVFTGTELGYPFYQDYFTIPSGDTGVFEVRTETPGSWRGDALAGSYRLVILGQTTIRPTSASVRIQAPPGMRFTRWSEGVRVQDDVATWAGMLGDDVELELSFEAPPLPVRVWRALTPF
jgi:hypothetical protein